MPKEKLAVQIVQIVTRHSPEKILKYGFQLYGVFNREE